MSKIRLGLIGAGGITRQHLKVIKDIGSLSAVGITSRSMAQTRELAREYDITVCAESIESMIETAKPDALMVLVSVDQTFSVTSQVLPYGLPLFIEKPAGISVQENRKLAELAQKFSVPTMVGLNRRYYSIFYKGLKIIRDHGPLLGVDVEGHERMWRVRESKNFTDAVMTEWIYANSIHTIDLLRFFGGEPTDIKTLTHRAYQEARGDQFAAIMNLASGGIGQYKAHWYSPGGWKVVLYGNEVTVEFKPLEKGFWTDRNFNVTPIETDEVDVKYKPGFYRQMEAFAKLIETRKVEWPMQDLEGSYHSMLLVEQMTKNIQDREESSLMVTKSPVTSHK